jgi:murein L,D-transpeptidase YcbB/YkuD
MHESGIFNVITDREILKYVKAFQKSVGIADDGVAGTNTFKKIKELAA